jgi:hypothetical protein
MEAPSYRSGPKEPQKRIEEKKERRKGQRNKNKIKRKKMSCLFDSLAALLVQRH